MAVTVSIQVPDRRIHSRVLIDDAVTVVVGRIARFHGSRIDAPIRVVAVGALSHEPDGRRAGSHSDRSVSI